MSRKEGGAEGGISSTGEAGGGTDGKRRRMSRMRGLAQGWKQSSPGVASTFAKISG